MKSHFVGVRMPPDLIARAKQRAEEDGRSLSNYIKNLIRQDLNRGLQRTTKVFKLR